MRVVMDREFGMAQSLGALPPLDATQKSVAILLATYNGARFLEEQLVSIERQTHTNWRVFASDDGSSDGTQAILAAFRERWGAERLRISHGPQRGHAANFLSLIQDAAIAADYYTFCDQDDVWLEDKLERSVRSIESVGEELPALYGSRAVLVDIEGNNIGLSPLFFRKPHLKNALVQSIAGGNTMTFNNVTRDCLRLIPHKQDVVTHDWATYLLVSACGGVVFYDPKPSINYRQHGENIIGSNTHFSDRIIRLIWLLKGRFAEYSENNLALVSHVWSKIPEHNAHIIWRFKMMRDEPLLSRIASLKRSGLYRQTLIGTIGLWAAVLLKKI